MRITRANTVGVVIDIQERLFPVMTEKNAMLEKTKTLVMGLQELSIPLLVTQQYTKGLGETIADVSTLISKFSYIEKTSFSCYDEPSFVSALEDYEPTNVIITGIESHVCVLQTAIDLKAAGYNPIIVWDAVSSRNKSDKKIALERLRYEGIMITTSESILFELIKSAKTPEFKAISRLIK